MNVVLWGVAALLAATFLAAGAAKLVQSKERMASSPNMEWSGQFAPWAIKAIGGVEVLGAVGLIVPAVADIVPVLVPLAAVGLALVMIGAAVFHTRRSEPQAVAVNAVLFALAGVVAWGRFGPHSF